jgi:hypothetical protein
MPKIGEIKIKDIDTSLATKGGRVLEVKCGSHSFLTPTRPFSAAEINAKSYLGYRGEIKSDIAAIALDFSGKRKELFFKNNGALNRSEKLLQSYSDASYSLPSMPLFQIDPFKAEEKSHFKLAFEVERSIEGVDILSMPGVIGTAFEFEKLVKNWCESSESDGFGSAVQLSLTEPVDSFSEKLDVLADYSQSGLFQILNVQYAPPSKVRQQLAVLWDKREEMNAIVNCVGVMGPRSESVPGIARDEEIILLQNGFDMITKKKHSVSQSFVKYLAVQPKATSIDDVDDYKVARHSASATIRGKLWNTMKHPPECRCSVCKGQTRGELIERFGYLDNGDISKSGLRYYSLLHDHQSDMQELDVFRKYVMTEGTEEYNRRIDDNFSELEVLSKS